MFKRNKWTCSHTAQPAFGRRKIVTNQWKRHNGQVENQKKKERKSLYNSANYSIAKEYKIEKATKKNEEQEDSKFVPPSLMTKIIRATRVRICKKTSALVSASSGG